VQWKDDDRIADGMWHVTDDCFAWTTTLTGQPLEWKANIRFFSSILTLEADMQGCWYEVAVEVHEVLER
jgi:hypothetical protein